MNTNTSLHLYEEVMLLALRDREGKTVSGSFYLQAIAGALLAELALTSRIRLVEKKKYVQFVDGAQFGDELLDTSLDLIRTAKRRKKAADWVAKLAGIKNLKHRAAQSLCRRGVLRHDEEKVLFIFTQQVYPEIDHEPEHDVIERLRSAITGLEACPDQRTIDLLSLAQAADLLKMVMDKKLLKENKKRIVQLSDESEIGKITRELIDAIKVVVVTGAIG